VLGGLAQPVVAWVICPECDPPVREADALCPECGTRGAGRGQRIGLVYVALEDKDRALVWTVTDTLCRVITSRGLAEGDPAEDPWIPWEDIAYYLPAYGLVRTKDGREIRNPLLVPGQPNPFCPRSPGLPARLLARPWVSEEWLFTPKGERVSLDRVRVLATSWGSLQEGKRHWSRLALGREALHPVVSPEDRKALSRLPKPLFTEDPVYPELPGRRLSGRVLVDVLVDRDGNVLCAVALRPGAVSESLQMAAIEAAYAWRFEPARKGRRRVAAWIPLPFRFEPR
jgi:TonB family protein